MTKKIQEAYEAGKKAYGKFDLAPHANKEFMKTVPNGEGFEIRIRMYKAYIQGYTIAMLNEPAIL